jgi:hypothetical protein
MNQDSSSACVSAVSGGGGSSSTVTILGFGSLLSEGSSRMTFPDLTNFRLGRVTAYRRIFGHPASIFLQRGLANFDTKEMSSLCAEYTGDDKTGFVCSAFEVPNTQMMSSDGVPTKAFLEREEEFDIIEVPFFDYQTNTTSQGILCTKFTDEGYIQRWGEDRFNDHFKKYGFDTIWGWQRDSGLRPCHVYLRHCYLAAKKMGSLCFESFLDETYLIDRETTIRQYAEKYPSVLESPPPAAFEERYSG